MNIESEATRVDQRSTVLLGPSVTNFRYAIVKKRPCLLAERRLRNKSPEKEET